MGDARAPCQGSGPRPLRSPLSCIGAHPSPGLLSCRCWKRSILAPDRKHSSGQEGHPPGPGLTPAYVLRSPLPGTDPNKSALGEAPLLLFCLTTNIEVVTVNTATPWRWKGADMIGLEWFSDVAPTPHRNMRHG